MNEVINTVQPGKKPSVLILAEAYLPGFLAGGPVRSIAALVSALGDEVNWKIITRDRDLGSSVPYPDVPADRWIQVGAAHVWYASAGRDDAISVIRLIRATPHDVLYINSFFSPHFAIAPAIAGRLGLLSEKKLLIAPRGEFSPGALALKRFKKAAYLKLARIFGVYRDARWHASTVLEREDIEQTLLGSNGRVWSAAPIKEVGVVADLPAGRPTSSVTLRPANRPLRVCFLSRIARKKNLDFALRVLALVRQPVDFVVYGPKEDEGYWRECVRLIENLPPHVKVIDGGAVSAEKVPLVLAAQDLFFLPTRGENFGHVFVEAWGAGLPVLTSDQTPWRDLQSKGIGWDLSLEESCIEKFAERIDALTSCPAVEYVAMRQRAIQAAAAICSDPVAVENNMRMFLKAAGYSEKGNN